jgi:hypothetical protein
LNAAVAAEKSLWALHGAKKRQKIFIDYGKKYYNIGKCVKVKKVKMRGIDTSGDEQISDRLRVRVGRRVVGAARRRNV